MKKNPITNNWIEARQLIKEGKIEQAEEKLDYCLVLLATQVDKGVKDNQIVEGVKLAVWFERVWTDIEKNIWPTREDYEKVWKC